MMKKIKRENSFKNMFLSARWDQKHFYALVDSLPEKAKGEYLKEYKRMKKDEGIAFFFHVLGFSYAYFGEWEKQLLFLMTWGGFGFWWLVNFFRLSTKTERANLKLARELFTYIKIKHDKYSSTGNQSMHQPRPVHFNYDLVNLNPNNLKLNFLIDYRLETWFVTAEDQYDWHNEQTDRNFQLSNKKDTVLSLYIENSTHDFIYYVGYEIKTQLVIPNLESIILRGNLPGDLTYRNETYYLERTKNGWLFKIDASDRSHQVTCLAIS